MKRLTIRETVRLHKLLWDWLVRNPTESKIDAFYSDPELMEYEAKFGVPQDCCFGCEQVMQRKMNIRHVDCCDCIFEWMPGTMSGCGHNRSAWKRWVACATGDPLRPEYAKQVRDLPLKKRYQRYL